MNNPFLDLTKQVLNASPYADTAEDLRIRQVLLEATGGTPFWGDDPGAYDTVRFAKNIFLPGICKVSGKGFEQKLQRDKPPGTHGARVRQLGIQPAKFEVHVRMWTSEHLQAFERLVPILLSQKYKTVVTQEAVGFTGNANGAGFTGVATPQQTKQVAAGPRAIDIYHPMLALFRIRQVHIVSVGIPHPSGERDEWEAVIGCEQFIYRPTQVKTTTETLEITEKTVGPTAFTLEQQRKANQKKPSDRTRSGKFGGGDFGGNGASGGF